MAIRTIAATDIITYTIAGSITGGTLIRYTVDGINHTVSILTTDTTAILALLNSLNIGDWTYSSGTYSCYNCLKALIGFRVDTGGGSHNDITFIGSENDYLVDYDLNGMACELETISARVPLQAQELNYGTCPCTCDFNELVFAGEADEPFKSDKTSYLFKKFDSGDGFNLKLYKNGSGTGIDINSSICSTDIWDFGDLLRNGINTNGSDQYAGFVIHWYLVYGLGGGGYGSYQIKGTYILGGVQYNYESHIFNLCAFNFARAKGTVKIECIQNGYNESEDYDYTGLNWFQSVRVEGKLFRGIPKITQDNYLTFGRRKTQIQDSILDEYTLELLPLPASISNFIAYNISLSNQMLISDYNVNAEVYKQLDLIITEIQEFTTWSNNTNIKGTFKCEPRVQNKIKRNFV